MRRLLYIAYHFPPTGGAGVQRSLKFIKYLPEFSVLPVVLTGSGESDGRWTPPDPSLQRDVPPGVPVRRITWPKPSHPGYGEHLKHALQAAHEAVRTHEAECILVSMSPFCDARIASELSARTGLPWIADLRDPWALDEFQVYRSAWHRQQARRLMGRALQSAAVIIMNTPESARRFKEAFPHIRSRVVAITNGYDAADFAELIAPEHSDKFTIVHSGFFHTDAGLQQRRRALEYRLLGRIEPGVQLLSRSHYYLVEALEKWMKDQPGAISEVRVRCVGAMTDTDHTIVGRSPIAKLFEFTQYLPHDECLRVVRTADLLFLPLHKMPPGRRSGIVPGKTYEYMASGRPILAALPEGDARDYVVNAGTGLVCEPDDVDGMVRILKEQFAAWKAGRQTVTWNREYVEQFERRRLTERLAEEIARTLNIQHSTSNARHSTVMASGS